jgi:hypothetical protein
LRELPWVSKLLRTQVEMIAMIEMSDEGIMTKTLDGVVIKTIGIRWT